MNPFSQIPGGSPFPQTSMEFSPYTPYPPYTPPPQYYTPHQNYSPTPQNIQPSYPYTPTTQPFHSDSYYPSSHYPWVSVRRGSILEFMLLNKTPEEISECFKDSICSFCGGDHHLCLCPIKPLYDHPFRETAYPTSSSPQFTNTNVSVTPTSLPSYEPQDSDDELEEIISEKLSDLEETLKKFMQVSDASMQNMENQLGQIAKALSEESGRSHPSDTKSQPEETNRDDHVSDSDCEGGNMMHDTLPDTFEDPPMFEDEEEDNSVKLFFQEYRKKFETVQDVTDEVTNHCDLHTETPQPFDLSLVSTPEEGKEKISLDDGATEVGLSIEAELGKDDYMLRESEGELHDVHNEEVSLHKQEFPSCTHAPVHSYVVSDMDFFDSLLDDEIPFYVENDNIIREVIDKNDVNESWDAFMESDTESGGEVVNVHDICEEEEDFSMVQFDYGVAPTPCFETSFEIPVIPRVIQVFTHVFFPPEEDESFILHFCADEGYEDHVLPSWADEFKDLRHLMTFVERKLEMLTISAPLQSLLLESLWGSCVGQTTLKIALLGRQPELFFSAFVFAFALFVVWLFCLCILFLQLRVLLWG
ncbi:unnamed protein product [Cuscuta epithymum]|uniref:Uncharacterized protein n=1 Tax=Cuscuta epithymum TaxID=186058 RepID=A0AAV0CAR0_9ASTE|nr:unnamed protein product [Cuscuta epithymum]